MTLLKEKFPQYFDFQKEMNKSVDGRCLVAVQDMFFKFLSPNVVDKLFYMGLFYTDVGYPFSCNDNGGSY